MTRRSPPSGVPDWKFVTAWKILSLDSKLRHRFWYPKNEVGKTGQTHHFNTLQHYAAHQSNGDDADSKGEMRLSTFPDGFSSICDEIPKERMRPIGARPEFGMILRSDHERVTNDFRNFNQ